MRPVLGHSYTDRERQIQKLYADGCQTVHGQVGCEECGPDTRRHPGHSEPLRHEEREVLRKIRNDGADLRRVRKRRPEGRDPVREGRLQRQDHSGDRSGRDLLDARRTFHRLPRLQGRREGPSLVLYEGFRIKEARQMVLLRDQHEGLRLESMDLHCAGSGERACRQRDDKQAISGRRRRPCYSQGAREVPERIADRHHNGTEKEPGEVLSGAQFRIIRRRWLRCSQSAAEMGRS